MQSRLKFTLSVTLFLSLRTLVHSVTPKSDLLDLTVLDETKLVSGSTLPDTIDLKIPVMGSEVNIHLARNKRVQGAGNSFVIEKGADGRPTLVRDTSDVPSKFGEYQDKNTSAIFTLSCNGRTDAGCEPSVQGRFVKEGVEYDIRPMDADSLNTATTTGSRTKRSLTNLWEKFKSFLYNTKNKRFNRKMKRRNMKQKKSERIYGVYKAENRIGEKGDYSDVGNKLPEIKPRESQAFKSMARTVTEREKFDGRTKNVEVLVVVDYPIYQRWLKTSNNDDKMAKFNIRKYFSHIINGVDMRYKSIDDPAVGIAVSIAGFVIADKEEVSEWTTPLSSRLSGQRDLLLVDAALDALINWSFRTRNMPERDHIMLFTGYDLFSTDSGAADNATAGFARVGAMCDFDSASVVEDHGGFQSINTAAHELGHSLGARHDGDRNTCIPRKQFVMTAHGGLSALAGTELNTFMFSSCSVNYFRAFLNRMPNGRCLDDPADAFNEQEYASHLAQYPGQWKNPNEQCQDILGLDSFYGWSGTLGNFEGVCTEMACFLPGTSGRYRIYKAAEGTTCGDKKWCIAGKCRFSEEAKIVDAKCVHGDSLRTFANGKSCRQYMLDRPSRCYDPFYKERCCETCARLHTGVRGCEYGNRQSKCERDFCDRNLAPNYTRACCSTCGLAEHPRLKYITKSSNERPPITRPTPAPRRRTTTTKVYKTELTTKAPAKIPVPKPAEAPKPPTMTTSVIDPVNQPPPLCLKNSGTFLIFLPCSSAKQIFGANACAISVVRGRCCEPCKGTQKPQVPACVDEPECSSISTKSCYSRLTRKRCCKTCTERKSRDTTCPYGDRLSSCSQYIAGLGFGYLCRDYGDYCCKSCAGRRSGQQRRRVFAVRGGSRALALTTNNDVNEFLSKQGTNRRTINGINQNRKRQGGRGGRRKVRWNRRNMKRANALKILRGKQRAKLMMQMRQELILNVN